MVKPAAGMTGPDAVRCPLTPWCDCLPQYWQDSSKTCLFLRILSHPAWRGCRQTRMFLLYSFVWQWVKGMDGGSVCVSVYVCLTLQPNLREWEWALEWTLEGFKRCRHTNVAKTFSFHSPKTNYWSDVWREAVSEGGRERDRDREERLSRREWEGQRGGG